MKQREFHPYAAIFDLLEGPKLDELAASIRKGYRKERPIILHPDGRIIDGRNRYIACQRAGVEPLYETWDGKGSLVDLIMALNRHRRHDTDGARSMQAARALPFYEEEARGRQAAAGGDRRSVGATVPEAIDGKRARDDAAKAFDVSPRSVQSAKKVLTNGVPELQAAVSSGAVGVAPAAEVAKLPPERQREVVAEGPASVTRAAKTVREERKAAPADATTQPAAPVRPVVRRLAGIRGDVRGPVGAGARADGRDRARHQGGALTHEGPGRSVVGAARGLGKRRRIVPCWTSG